MPILVVVTCALVAVVAVVAVPRARAPEPTPPPVREEEPERPRIESVMPDPALDADAVAAHEAKVAANESAVEELLQQVVAAQAKFQARARADEDGDGVGEYGSLGELAGFVAVRGGARLDPPMLPQLNQGDRGRFEYMGYYLRVHLAADDVDLEETTWCCYAWPVEPETGRTYFVSQLGDILANEESPYGGDLEPAAAAAYRPGADALTGEAAVNAKGNDGATWRFVR